MVQPKDGVKGGDIRVRHVSCAASGSHMHAVMDAFEARPAAWIPREVLIRAEVIEARASLEKRAYVLPPGLLAGPQVPTNVCGGITGGLSLGMDRKRTPRSAFTKRISS